MRSYITKSIMLGLAMVAAAGCGSSDKTQGSTASVNAAITIATGGETLNTVHYVLSCTGSPAFSASGDWNVTNSTATDSTGKALVGGVIGGMAPGSVCALTLSGTDSKNGSCTAAVANITASANNTVPLSANVSLVCNDGNGGITQHGPVGSITGLAQVTVCGTSNVHTCAGIASWVANPLEVAVGQTISLTAAASAASNSDGSPASESVAIAFSENGTAIPGGASATYTCTTAGPHTITIAVTDSFTAPSCGTGAVCGTNSDTFQIACGGQLYSTSPATGGAPGTGGAGTGGAPPATGGSLATGGSAAIVTGGAPPATGGSAATGGLAATGGSSTPPLGAMAAIINAIPTNGAVSGAACLACAQTSCTNNLDGKAVNVNTGAGACDTVVPVYKCSSPTALGESASLSAYDITTATATFPGFCCIDPAPIDDTGSPVTDSLGNNVAIDCCNSPTTTLGANPKNYGYNLCDPVAIPFANPPAIRSINAEVINTATNSYSPINATATGQTYYTNEPTQITLAHTTGGTNASRAGGTDYYSGVAGAFQVTAQQYCLDLLTCLVGSSCDQGALATCYCGSSTTCTNENIGSGATLSGGGNGKCWREEENALNTTAPYIPTEFGDVTQPGGPANELVNCLANGCATECGM